MDDGFGALFSDFSFNEPKLLDQKSPSTKVSAFSIDDGEVRVQCSNLFGLDIEDAVIMRALVVSHPPVNLPGSVRRGNLRCGRLYRHHIRTSYPSALT
jgi:hypothetical protein